jgi:two-component system, OmpR family, sensor histidine kinase KdpD
MRGAAARLASSTGLTGMLLWACSRLPHVDEATVALAMVLAIVGIAAMWGRAAALAGAMVGGLGFDYYFLPPAGFGIAAPEHWVAMAVFLITAIIVGELTARLTRRRIEAEARTIDVENLHRLSNAALKSGPEFSLAHLVDELVDMFRAAEVALYDEHTGQIVRSGPRAGAIADEELHGAATDRVRLKHALPAVSLAPIHYGGRLVGSLGVCGAKVSQSLLSAIGTQVGMGLATLDSMKKIVEAEAARRSDELKSAVLDAVAHDIRNPLNSIKIAATTLLSGHEGDELFRRELLTIIDQEADRMDRALDDAAHLAAAEAAALSLKKEPQNLARLIPVVIEEMGALASRNRIQVSVPEWLPRAECDKGMIGRVFKQLLGNALKYSPEGSPLNVSAEFANGIITIDVVDHGPGVRDEERDRIFEKYYRGSAARSDPHGTGLGLASARSIVQAHGGDIWVTSPPAGGAAFHVSLPVGNGPPFAGEGEK